MYITAFEGNLRAESMNVCAMGSETGPTREYPAGNCPLCCRDKCASHPDGENGCLRQNSLPVNKMVNYKFNISDRFINNIK